MNYILYIHVNDCIISVKKIYQKKINYSYFSLFHLTDPGINTDFALYDLANNSI